MPLIGITEVGKNRIDPKILINAHIKSVDGNLILVILNKLTFPEIAKEYLEAQQVINTNYVDHIDEDEEYIIIYKVPDKYIDDYDKIIEGKYSETSLNYKKIIIDVYGVGRNNLDYLPSIYDCLYPTDIKRKMYGERVDEPWELFKEVSSKPDLEYEIYKPINKLK